MNQQENNRVQLLLVDDDEVDRELVTRGIRQARLSNKIVEAKDGEEALHILRGTGGFEKIPRPYFILLDWKMPKMGGAQFLKELREDPELRDSIVMVLTTSDSERDKIDAYKYQISGYMVKDRAGDDFFKIADFLGAYWAVVEFPVQGSVKLGTT